MKRKYIKLAGVTTAFVILLSLTQIQLNKKEVVFHHGTITSETVEFDGSSSVSSGSSFDNKYDLRSDSLDVNELDYSDVTVINSENEWHSYVSACISKDYKYMFFKAPENMSFNLDMVMKTNDITAITIYTIPSADDNSKVTGYNFTYTYSHDILTAVKNGTTSSLDSKMKAALSDAQSFVSGLNGRSDYEKELSIHNYVCSKLTYTNDSSNDDIINCYGGLVLGRGNCQAYTDSFNLLCGLAGLTSGRITCTASGIEHSLNYVQLDGKYYFTDCTFDDGISDSDRGYGLFYFNLPYSVICSDHDFDYITFNVDGNIDSNNYYFRSSTYADSAESLKQVYTNMASSGITKGEILFYDGGQKNIFLTDIFAENPCGYTNISTQKYAFGDYQVLKFELS